MAVLSDGEMMIQFPHMRVLRCDIHGKFLGYVKNEEIQENNMSITKHYLHESVTTLPLLIP
jgi:hypothetical protein